MKVTVNKDELVKALSVVGRVVVSRAQLPVLANVLLETENEGLLLMSTNLELGMRVRIGGKVEEAGKITAPAKSLAEFVSTLPDGGVDLTTKGEMLHVGRKGFEGNFLGIAAAEFPVLAKMGNKDNANVKIPTNVLEKVARQVAYAAATDESRPVLTGVRLDQGDKYLEFTATDGFRLCRKRIQDIDVSTELAGMILPAKTIVELAKLISEGRKSEVIMEVSGSGGNQVIFEYGNTELISRVLEGNFPDINKIIPSGHKTRFIVDREKLVGGVRAAAIFARESNNIIKFVLEEGKLTIRATANQNGEGEIEVEGDLEGDSETVAFNYRYVMDFLNSIDEERVVLESNGGLTAGIWKMEKDQSLTHLIMPVRV